MEGLIPLVYKAVMQIRYGNESQQLSSSYYVRLPGDSGRFVRSDLDVSGPGSNSSNRASSSTSTTSFAVYAGVQSPVSRQVVT
ncbi:hypothetical protein AtNW77_Chr2g0259111 [Arabidopsis thaliana]|uniref:Uncharacterized protein n=3 Tax=Arabidopsis TaxID=3701 RepID=A0A178VMS1_ARATH|nr:hypothetical protein ISN45_At02g032600 [Arabidopsis thaliana x Arabidopsis arenosa]KAG7643473.1 hypothetical protein ISN44_As02g032780 [Arabidopsis suecica]OAP07609.1 hypothetical protein AXX17_AT2G34580 [Arabidopsis thaliana]